MLVLNGVVVLLVAVIEPGLHVDSLGAGIVVALGLTVVNTAVTIAAGDRRRRLLVPQRRQAPGASASARPVATDVPGLLFLEIDGLAHDVLARAMRDGNAPTMARWLREGSHRLARWETDWSSQTGACQAGLLHGDNDDMPAFRWWEKDRGKAIVTNHPRDAMELERRHSDGRGLLFSDGASRANILSGDAPHSLLTMSTVLQRDRPGRIGQDYFAYFANPYNVAAHAGARGARGASASCWARAQQQRRDVAAAHPPRLRLRAHARVGDDHPARPAGRGGDRRHVRRPAGRLHDVPGLRRGRPPLGHRARPTRCSTLRRVDRQIGRIAAARRDAPRPYRLVVLSDHGQSQGATFLDRYGITLEELVREAAAAPVAAAAASRDEALGYLGASLTEASGGDVAGGPGGPSRRAPRARSTARCSSARATRRRRRRRASRPRSW